MSHQNPFPLLAFLALILIGTAFAPGVTADHPSTAPECDVPSNDCFAHARGVTLPFSVEQSTVGASTESGEPTSCSGMKSTVWFRFTPLISDTYIVSTLGSDFDTVVAVYTGSELDSLESEVCANDWRGGKQAFHTWEASEGTTYYVQVGGRSTTSTGNLVLDLRQCNTPVNDCFAHPRTLTVNSTVTQSTEGATSQVGERTNCHDLDATVWFAFTAPYSARFRVTTLDSDYDTVVAVRSSPTAFSTLECDNDWVPTRQSTAYWDATNRTTYYIQVGGVDGATGNLAVRVEPCDVPANDCFKYAAPITADSEVNQMTSDAWHENGEPVMCGAGGEWTSGSVWYKFTPSASKWFKLDTFGSDYDTVLAVHTGSNVKSLTQVACNDDSDVTLQSSLRWFANRNTDYYIQVAGWHGAMGNLILSLETWGNTYTGKLLLGTGQFEQECFGLSSCILGYNGGSTAPVALEPEDAGKAFSLTATARLGSVNVDIRFLDADGDVITEYASGPNESGQVPVDATDAVVVARSGVDVAFTLQTGVRG